jgi:hypothetical protein
MHLVAIFATLIPLFACVNEPVVYQRNLHPAYLSPVARRLPKAELEQIAQLLARRTHQSIVGITGASNPKYHGQLLVYTAFPGASERGGFGLFTVEKRDGQWRIIEGGEDAEPFLVQTMGAEP